VQQDKLVSETQATQPSDQMRVVFV